MNKLKGYIYCGCYIDNHNIKTYKIGYTTKTPSRRQYDISMQNQATFNMIKYVTVNNTTKQDLMFIESWLRRELSKYIEYNYTSNDHFNYIEEEHNTEYITNICINSIVKCLHFIGHKDYVIKDKVNKRI